MRKLTAAAVLLLGTAAAAQAIPGATDRRPAASLIVPFFEVGRDAATHPHDTLLVVSNIRSTDRIIHYHFWNVVGEPVFGGNAVIPGNGTWSASVRDLLAPLPAGTRSRLAAASYYHGFVTIDAVIVPTTAKPTDQGYPFDRGNPLEGWIYYVQLALGSANGLDMIPVERQSPAATSAMLTGFYQHNDSRERLDQGGRWCADEKLVGGVCDHIFAGSLADEHFDRVDARFFGATGLASRSRAIVFTWGPRKGDGIGGPSTYCDNASCESEYPFDVIDESGRVRFSSRVRLGRVVNIIDLPLEFSGRLTIRDVYGHLFHTFVFSFNQANPAGDPRQSWGTVFEGYLLP